MKKVDYSDNDWNYMENWEFFSIRKRGNFKTLKLFFSEPACQIPIWVGRNVTRGTLFKMVEALLIGWKAMHQDGIWKGVKLTFSFKGQNLLFHWTISNETSQENFFRYDVVRMFLTVTFSDCTRNGSLTLAENIEENKEINFFGKYIIFSMTILRFSKRIRKSFIYTMFMSTQVDVPKTNLGSIPFAFLPSLGWSI